MSRLAKLRTPDAGIATCVMLSDVRDRGTGFSNSGSSADRRQSARADPDPVTAAPVRMQKRDRLIANLRRRQPVGAIDQRLQGILEPHARRAGPCLPGQRRVSVLTQR